MENIYQAMFGIEVIISATKIDWIQPY